MENRAVFRNRILPFVLVAPEMILVAVFFLWPAAQALVQSVMLENAFGLSRKFVGLRNFAAALGDPFYLKSVAATALFSVLVAGTAMSVALLLAVQASGAGKAATAYQTLIVWPYAVAPAVAGVLWFFLFNPTVGIIVHLLRGLGVEWSHTLRGDQAFALVVIAAAWKQVSYNFLFYVAGLHNVPRSLLEAAAIDGASPGRRFAAVIFPLLTPTTFFLLVMNLVYSLFDTFGIIHQVTQGGPSRATETLVYKVYRDGFLGLDLGGSAAQSVVLMTIAVALTALQFRYLERRVEYDA